MYFRTNSFFKFNPNFTFILKNQLFWNQWIIIYTIRFWLLCFFPFIIQLVVFIFNFYVNTNSSILYTKQNIVWNKCYSDFKSSLFCEFDCIALHMDWHQIYTLLLSFDRNFNKFKSNPVLGFITFNTSLFFVMTNLFFKIWYLDVNGLGFQMIE